MKLTVVIIIPNNVAQVHGVNYDGLLELAETMKQDAARTLPGTEVTITTEP